MVLVAICSTDEDRKEVDRGSRQRRLGTAQHEVACSASSILMWSAVEFSMRGLLRLTNGRALQYTNRRAAVFTSSTGQDGIFQCYPEIVRHDRV